MCTKMLQGLLICALERTMGKSLKGFAWIPRCYPLQWMPPKQVRMHDKVERSQHCRHLSTAQLALIRRTIPKVVSGQEARMKPWWILKWFEYQFYSCGSHSIIAASTRDNDVVSVCCLFIMNLATHLALEKMELSWIRQLTNFSSGSEFCCETLYNEPSGRMNLLLLKSPFIALRVWLLCSCQIIPNSVKDHFDCTCHHSHLLLSVTRGVNGPMMKWQVQSHHPKVYFEWRFWACRFTIAWLTPRVTETTSYWVILLFHSGDWSEH